MRLRKPACACLQTVSGQFADRHFGRQKAFLMTKRLFYISFLLSLFLIACNSHQDKKEVEYCLTKYPKDSADYTLIKGSFYKGKDGSIYEKKIEVDKFTPPYCYLVTFDKYINKFYEDSVVQIPLDSIIDIRSFVCFDSSSYSKDKARCYYYYDNSDGGFRQTIPDADIPTFKSLKYHWWAADKDYVYYRGDKVRGLNIKAFEILPNSSIPEYIKDDKHVFYKLDSIHGADLNSFETINEINVDAKDKYHWYYCGKIVK
jgi:hypothetical protein